MMRPHPHHPTRRERLLNGWWDILPQAHHDLAVPLEPEATPTEGWTVAAYLVPGFFTDAGYPDAWRETRTAWARTAFAAPELTPDQRAILTVDAAIPRAHLFVNGARIAVQDDMFIGDPVDITDRLQAGENELAVLLTNHRRFPHPDTGELTLEEVPWGCCISRQQAGIWQDVRLDVRPETHIAHTTIRTSVRESRLWIRVLVRNASARPFQGELVALVETGTQTGPGLSPQPVTLAPGEATEVTVEAPWSNYRAWSPEDPRLYHLDLLLVADGRVVDAARERFGYREVWIDGHRIRLNGQPQRWYGEWAHKAHAHWLRPEYVRQWYQQLRDLNMNYVRLHTFPHPEMYLDIADEMGILICQETALYGSFQGGLDTPNLWPNAAAHVRRMVRRDGNHPSLVLWSVENEMRWALNTMPQARVELPRLRHLFRELDPTRPAIHDGDSGIWNEREQELISRHYGPACHGWGWWDHSRPLLAGELGRWHYGSPHVALTWDDDAVYTDYGRMCRSIAQDAARIIELGRANEVSCLFPWNTSGLDNLRPGEERTFDWPDPAAPHAKPLVHTAYQSEYAWWRDEEPYRPGPSFAALRRANRPVALVPWQERSGYYNDDTAAHRVFLVNDLPHEFRGSLTARLVQDGRALWEDQAAITAPAGGTTEHTWQIPLASLDPGDAILETQFVPETDADAAATDAIQRPLRIGDPAARNERLRLPPVGVWGQSALIPWLEARGVQAQPVSPEALPHPADTPIIVVGEGTVQPGSPVTRAFQAYCQAGGRLLVLEQQHSLFPGLALQRLPNEAAHLRDPQHPVVAGIAPLDLRFWGDDPYGLPSSTSWVTTIPYVKPSDVGYVHPIIDSSGGDFGTGGLGWAPVMEARIGQGIAIGMQLNLVERLGRLPVADRLLSNALRYLAGATRPQPQPIAVDEALATAWPARLATVEPSPLHDAPPAHGEIALVSGSRPAQDPAAWHRWLERGGTLLLWDLQPEALASWQQALGAEVTLQEPAHPVYHLIRAASDDDPAGILAGLSNEDTCWLENWQYTRTNRKEPIASHLLASSVGRALLTNAPRAGLDVLFGDERSSERERMVAMSAYLDADPPPTLGALVEIAVGRGRALVCQVHWRPEKWQFRRLLGTLLWNLAGAGGIDILDGDTTPTSGRRSDGYPQSVLVAVDLDDGSIETLRQASERQVEYCSDNATFLQQPHWQRAGTPDGQLTVTAPSGGGTAPGRVVIGLQVSTPTARKLTSTLGGLPNPDLQTHLALTGAGSVQAWINGAAWPRATLEDGQGRIADIDLEAGANSVLLVWEPADRHSTLGLRFVDKHGDPEITYAFG